MNSTSERSERGAFKLSRLSVRDLEVQARVLETQIKRLDHRPRPTPSERELMLELKKMRLATKDRLQALGKV